MKTFIAIFTIVTLTLPALAEEKSPLPTVPVIPKKTATNEPTVITSEKMEGDYANNLGTFTGNVLVTDPRLNLRADKMVVYFGTTGSTNKTNQSIKRIIAEGGVVISQEDRKATSDHAEYIADEGKVILSGNPMLKNPDGTISGHRITFWRDSERMEVESNPAETNRTRLVIFPEEIRKKEPAPAPEVPPAVAPQP